MGNILTVAGRELRSYFASPVAYVLTGVYAFFFGFIFSIPIFFGAQQNAELGSTFSWMMVLVLILTPALTMRLFAEETRMGTIELLMTAPLRDWQIVVGKYLAGLLEFVVLQIPTLWYVLILWHYGPPDYGMLVASYLGVILTGAAFIAVGMFASALTGNQIVAFFIGFLTLIFFWVTSWPASLGGSGFLVDFLNQLALTTHFQDFFNGVVDTTHVLFFIGLAAVAIFLTVQVVGSRRWR